MGRPAKVTKYSLQIALSRSLNIAQTARYLAVDRHTVYDAAKRFGVNLSTAFERFSTPLPAAEAPEQSAPPLAPPGLPKSPIPPSGDARRFALADYTGPNRGDVSKLRTRGFLDRYRALRGN